MACTALGARILFVAVLLVFENEGDKLGREECRVGMGNDAATRIAESEPGKGDDFGSAWSGCLGEFAGAHGKEPRTNEEVGDNGRHTVAEKGVGSTRGGVQAAQESWGDCLLPVGWGI
jgi:hypothetical protein